MPSQFVTHFTKPLVQLSRPLTPAAVSQPTVQASRNTNNKHSLHGLLISFNKNEELTLHFVTETVNALASLDPSVSDPEQDELVGAVVAKLTVALYADALDSFLAQATEVEAEAEWWGDIERSRINLAWYLLQTLPSRVTNLAGTIVRAVRANNLPLQFSTITPTSLRRLFPSPDVFRPSALTTALFPHLAAQSLPITASTFLFPPFPPPISSSSIITNISRYFHLISTYMSLPLTLTLQECRHNRKKLEYIRDQRAEVLGQLALLRGPLVSVLEEGGKIKIGNSFSSPESEFASFVRKLDQTVDPDVIVKSNDTSEEIFQLALKTIPAQSRSHSETLRTHRLLRPSRLILLWPKLLFLPPLALYTVRSLYASRTTYFELAKDAKETVEGFFRGWLIEPLKDVLKTVRAGSEEGVLVRREGVMADLESLERMTLSLAKDELHYNDSQLAALSKQIRVGDLTPVLELYEEDIRRPLRSALTGTLLRSVFIQVQKAKVDIDQALTGIDKLLKSQELTFAFVGVAPALAIIYLTGGALAGVWGGAQGRGRYGGLHRRKSVFATMRRIERLITSQPPLSTPTSSSQMTLPPLSAGLLLLSLTQLREYANKFLPVRSRLREGFLEDIEDLEDPELSRDSKLKVVERMWRCWGNVLGWSRAPGEGVGR